jgi:glycosyltransferase involved in cell wall biosynthesis
MNSTVLKGNKVFNVLHIASRLPVGGVENMLLSEVTNYNKKRFNVTVCCIKEGGEIADELKRLGYKVVVLNKMKGHGFDTGALTALCQIIKKENIDVLRTHQYHANFYGRIAGILSGVPVIIPTFHNVYESPNKPKFHRRIFNYLLGLFSSVLIACSNTVAADMIRYDKVRPDKIKVVYNGLNINKFNSPYTRDEARKLLNLPGDEIIIGSVGRLDKQKGHHYLIEAAAKLKDHTIAIAGDGPLREELKKQASGLNSKVLFAGTVMPEEVPIFMRALDIFCFPSLWEGFGIAIAEAMAAGLPVVASDIAPLREVVGDAGIIVTPRDSTELAKAIKMLIDDSSLRDTLAKKAKDRAKAFSIDRSVKAFEGLFESMLSRKGLL